MLYHNNKWALRCVALCDRISPSARLLAHTRRLLLAVGIRAGPVQSLT